jgi:inner membrane protein
VIGMKWINHIAIGAATTALVSPLLVPVAVLGSTAPDWLEWLPKITGRRQIKHRTSTHYLAVWLLAVLFFWLVVDWRGIGCAFAWGGLTHIFCDALTASGVPFGWWSDRRFYLFGGRLKTGQNGEYWVSGAIVIVCVCLIFLTKSYDNNFKPFFYDYAGMYNDGTIDAKEWRDNRLRFF